MQRLFLLLFTAVFTVSARAQSSHTIARLDSLFDALEAADQMRGSVAVSKGDRIIYTRTIGPAAVVKGKPVAANAETAYRIGSITKTFTAVLVMHLVEEGKLALDMKLARFFPTVPNADRVTIEQLLSHRSGLANYTADSTFETFYRKRQTRQDLLARLSTARPDFPPDSTFEYSNTNYMLLGWIVEDLRKKSFADAVRDGITARLGLTHTRVADSVVVTAGEAISFRHANDRWVEETDWDGTVAGSAGNIVSTPSELLRFEHALFTGRLLKPATVARMQQFIPVDGKKNGYGLGIFSTSFGARTAWGHNGGIAGFHSLAYYFPTDSTGTAILLSGERFSLTDIRIGMLSAVYDSSYRIPDFNRQATRVSDTVLQRYAGTYFSKDFPLKIFIRAESGQLIARATGQGPFGLKALSETEFFFEDAGIDLRFATGVDGKWNVMHFDQKGYKVQFTKELE